MIRGAEPAPRIAALRATFTLATARAAIPCAAVGLLLAIAIALVGHEVDHHLGAIETWITDLGP